mmetsp:Transcript_25139/g.35212  ORF Transcript_25139/g.35212 Transcript_25139/m.35212 type:complete len:96 (-) Transcript_25139:219-506(-)
MMEKMRINDFLDDVRRWKDKSIPLKIMHISTRGIYTLAKRHPSTSKFAEAFIDWYLLGESDVVVPESHCLPGIGCYAPEKDHLPTYHNIVLYSYR